MPSCMVAAVHRCMRTSTYHASSAADQYVCMYDVVMLLRCQRSTFLLCLLPDANSPIANAGMGRLRALFRVYFEVVVLFVATVYSLLTMLAGTTNLLRNIP